LERFYAGGTRNLLRLDAEHDQLASVFNLAAGQGVHVPVTAPHWVKNGPEGSVSFSVTFRTDASDRREIPYRINHRMRHLRLRPSPVGASPATDAAKYYVFDLARRTARSLSRPFRRERARDSRFP